MEISSLLTKPHGYRVFLVKNDKYTLTDTQLKRLLLVSRVLRGVKVKNEGNTNETITSIERFPSEESVQISRNDETPVKK